MCHFITEETLFLSVVCVLVEGVLFASLTCVRFRFFGRLLVKRFAQCYRTVDLSCLSVLSVTLVYCGQTVGWIKMKLGMEVGLGPGHIVLDGRPSCPRKGHSLPLQFLAHVRCGQTAGGRHCVRRRPSSPSPKGGTAAPPPIFGPCLLWPKG